MGWWSNIYPSGCLVVFPGRRVGSGLSLGTCSKRGWVCRCLCCSCLGNRDMIRTRWHQNSSVTALNPLGGASSSRLRSRTGLNVWSGTHQCSSSAFTVVPCRCPGKRGERKEFWSGSFTSLMSGERWISTFVIHRVVSAALCFGSLDRLSGMCLVCKTSPALCSSSCPLAYEFMKTIGISFLLSLHGDFLAC